MESKNDNLENAREVTFNKDNASGREKLFGKAFNNKTQWIEYRSTDKYLQTVTWAFKGNDFSNPSGVVSAVLYHVDNGVLREVDNPDPFLTVDKSSLSFGYSGGSDSFTISSNVSWTVTSSATWCTVSPSSGSNNGTVTVKASENTTTDDRTATITVTGGGITRTIAITQKSKSEFEINDYGNDSDLDGNSLVVNTTSLQFDATAATKDISLTGNDNWTATSNATSWCTVSPASGTAPSTIKVTATANNTTSSRTAIVTIKGTQSDKTFTVTVTQKGVEWTLDASPTTLQFDASAGTKNISLTGNDNWTATSNATSWCTVSPTSGTAPGTIKVTATANSGTSSRTATITIKGTYSGKTITVSVTQKGNSGFDVNPYGGDSNLDGYSLATNTTSLNFDAAASTKDISLTGNDNWTVTSSVSWCTLSPTSGTAPGTIKVTVQKNNSSQRTATITIKGSKSGKTLTVNLTQSAGGSTGFDREGYGSDTDLD